MRISRIIIVLVFNFCFLNYGASQGAQQESTTRVYKDIFVAKDSFYPEDYELFRATLFTYDSENKQLYIYDYEQNNLFNTSISDYKIDGFKEIGRGKGSGPGEFRNPTSVCIGYTNTGTKIVIVDSDLARVSVWNGESENFERSFATKRFSPFRVACTSSEIIVFSSVGSKKGDYLIFNYEGKEIGSIEDPQENKNIFLDSGYIVANSKNAFYSSSGRPFIKKFSLDSDASLSKLFIEPQISPNKISKPYQQGDYILEKRDENFIYQSRGIGVFENYILMLYSGRKDAYSNTIDFYDFDLNYQFSSNIDLFSQYMTVSGNILLVRGFDNDIKKAVFKFYQINLLD